MARPVVWTKEKKEKAFSEIIERISECESVRSILKDEHLPSFKTFIEWVDENKEFSKQYARAMEIRADALFEEMFDIADDGINDWVERHDKKGESYYELNGEHIQRSKLRLDARKWALSKMNPKKYGDKLDVTSNNEHINSQNDVLKKFLENQK